MSGATLVTASNRKRVVIFASILLVVLIFISFKPRETSWTPWPPGSGSNAKPPKENAVTEGPDKAPAESASPKSASHGGSKATATSTAASKASSSAKPVATSAKITTDAVCKDHAKTSDMLVVMKTGATEAYDKLPIHFLTTLRCANDTILFSDMEMEMGGHHIIDSLADVKDDIKDDNPDFELYDLLKQYHALFEDPRSLKSGGNGWNLDKYKFNHMMLKTWQYREDPDWYVFIEADTYLVWDNLRTLLDKYDPDKPMYIGSPTYLDIEFAHGGTGYIISRAAMKKAVGGHPDIADRYDKEVHGVCCGDRFPARILLDEDIKLTKAWPMFNGEKPLTLPYGKNHWCQPLITMHHMTAQEVSQVWTFEQLRKQRGIKSPMMIKDIFNHFIKENLDKLAKDGSAKREDWDNLSTDVLYKQSEEINSAYNEGKDFASLSDVKRQSVQGPDQCGKLCESEDDCYGWSHKDNECRLSHSIKIGGHMSPDNGKRMTAGWNMKMIRDFMDDMGDCPNGPDWTVRGI